MKKIIILLLTLCLFACSDNKQTPTFTLVSEPYDYITKLKEYEVPTFRNDEGQINQEFEAYLNEEFKKTISSDYMSLHYALEDYSHLDIAKPELSLGNFDFDLANQVKEIETDLAKLRSFDFNSLSLRQQIDYAALEYSLLETQAMTAYGQYRLLFDSDSSYHSNLVTNFSEFTFRNKEDFSDYLVLLADLDRFLSDAIEYTKAQAKLQIALQDYSLDETLEYINKLTSKKEDNIFIVNFDLQVDKFQGLTSGEKVELKKQNKDLVLNEVIPAYENLAKELKTLKGQSRLDAKDAGAANYDAGYGELVIYLKASNNRELDYIYDELLMTLIDEFLYFYDFTESEEDMNRFIEVSESPKIQKIFNLPIEDKIKYLIKHTRFDYPDLGEIDYEVSTLDPSIADPNVLAYYVTAPLDNLKQNVIRINPSTLEQMPQTAYMTLAHEGFPGHLYENAYANSFDYHPIRSLLSFIAYTEGHAMMASKDAYRYLDEANKDVMKAMAFNDFSFGYYLESFVQIGVNGYGWSLDECKTKVKDIFMLDDETIKAMYEGAVSSVGTIIPYGYGLAKFSNYEDIAISSLGAEFDYVDYHGLILKNGALPFNILEALIFN